MRIVNWNVERPEIDSSKNAIRVDYLLGMKPDIVVLTETSKSVDLGNDFIGLFTDPSPRKPRVGEAVAAIWIRKATFSSVCTIDTSDPREAVCARIESDSIRFLVYGSIIPYHAAKGPDGTSKHWEEHKKAIAWHRHDWLKLKESFPKHSLIAAGDYNQHRDGIGSYGTVEIRQMLSEAMSDAELTCVSAFRQSGQPHPASAFWKLARRRGHRPWASRDSSQMLIQGSLETRRRNHTTAFFFQA